MNKGLKNYRIVYLLFVLVIAIGFSTKTYTKIKANEDTVESSTLDFAEQSTTSDAIAEMDQTEETEASASLDSTQKATSSEDSVVEMDQTSAMVESSDHADENSIEPKLSEDMLGPFSFYTKSGDQTKEFGATAIPQVLEVGDTFNKKPEELVKNILLPEGHTASFTYVDGKIPFIDNTTNNSVILKVYMVDNEQPENKVLIKIPLAIMAKNSPLKIAEAQEFRQLSIDYVDYSAKVKTEQDQRNYLQEKAGIILWEIETGNPVPIVLGKSYSALGTLPSANPSMYKKFELGYTPSGVDKDNIKSVVKFTFRDKPNDIEQDLLKELMSGWDHLRSGSELGIIRSKSTEMWIGMPNRGSLFKTSKTENGYQMGDGIGGGAGVNPFGSLFPQNNYYAYIGNEKNIEVTDSAATQSLNLIYYLKKGEQLRQVFVDQKANIIYVIDAYQLKNGYLAEEFSIYNTALTNTTIGAFSGGMAEYAGFQGTTSLYSMGSGFKNNRGGKQTFSFKFKDGRGNFLGDQDRWIVGISNEGVPSAKPPIIGKLWPGIIYFKDDFSKLGMENDFYPNNTILIGSDRFVNYTVYQMGAKPRAVASGKKLTTKIHFFVGKEIPYMKMEATPEEYNVYEDYDQDTKFGYELSNIPAAGNNGKITFTFPDQTTERVNYIADDNKTSKGTFTVPRATLPKILNSTPGTIKSYVTDLFAEDEELGIPTDEYAVPINVYNLGGKAIPQLIQKDKVFTKKPQDLIKDPVILPGNTAMYEYEGELPDTSKVGLTSVLVRMTDKERPEKTTLINVPVEVTSGTPPTSGLYIAANDYTDLTEELQGITETQISERILKKSEAQAWNITTGTTEDITLSVASTTLKPNASAGNYTATLRAVQAGKTFDKTVKIVINDKFIEDLKEGWTDIPLNSKLGVIQNPINYSKIGFNKRGMTNSSYSPEEGFTMRDKDGKHYLDQGQTSFIPYVSNKILYGNPNRADEYNLRRRGIGFESLGSGLSEKYFLKKGNALRQILIDSENQLTYVLDISLAKNLNFAISFKAYNRSEVRRQVALLELGALGYIGNVIPVYALKNNSGFYIKPSTDKKFTLNLKDRKGNWLSDYRRMAPGRYADGASSGSLPNVPYDLVYENWFKDDFSKEGIEQYNYPNGTALVWGQKHAAYQFGVPPKSLGKNEFITGGYELSVGTEVPFMKMTTDPKKYNVYEDYSEDISSTYSLSNIPKVNDTGTITFTYPDGTTSTQKYKADSTKTSSGPFTVPIKTLPKELNTEPGTIKTYETEISAINEEILPDLPSNEYDFSIDVYNLGAKAIPQLIQKDKAFKKKPQDLIKDPVILPGNTAMYEYEGELPDTSVVGLTSVLVRMTDKERPEKTTLIKVPVEVTSGIPPMNGLYIMANDYTGLGQELQGITEAQVSELILKNSEAVAWDIATGSNEGISLSVTATTLKPNALTGTYKATLKAVQGTLTKTKDITITIVDKQTVKVAFLDEAGESMHEPVSLLRTVGTKIDLTKEEEVQTAIKEIQNERYQIYQRPENETALVVPTQDTTVDYRFKGTLFVSSYPTFMNFGVKSLQANTPFIRVESARYNKPLTIWDNRKGTKSWQLTATVEKALTSHEDTSKILPDALRYKKDQSNTVILKQGTSVPIRTKKNQEAGDINISEGWDKGESGLQLEVPTGKVLQTGKYYATILWQVAETP
ncbi:hypothetical protein JZO73_14340 [Enterococcus plantarum]|uniref:hypothetical protein n=1 Tax=Enterococcus plantarum TaxID=1077675 RepID=UPI001A8E75C5|nr:hypothetical protein [Enterococcus plantarum]MBO0468685.1 hypothetical protein [Enterococcus plantarum]